MVHSALGILQYAALIAAFCLMSVQANSQERSGFVVASEHKLKRIGISFKRPGGQDVLDVLHSNNHMISAKSTECFQSTIAKKEFYMPGGTNEILTTIDLRSEIDASILSNFSGELKIVDKIIYESRSVKAYSVDPYDAVNSFKKNPGIRCLGKAKITIQTVFLITGTYSHVIEFRIRGKVSTDLGKKVKALIGQYIPEQILKAIDLNAVLEGRIRQKTVDGFVISNPTRLVFEPLRVSKADIQRKIDWDERYSAAVPINVTTVGEKTSTHLGPKRDACGYADKFDARAELIAFNDSFGIDMDDKNSVIFDPAKDRHRKYAAIINKLQMIHSACSSS